MALTLLAGGLSFSAMNSATAATPISTIDTSLSTYDKIVMNVDGKPFFFNGIQIRDDKIVERFNYTDAQMANVYQLAADDGFTVVNSQILWSMIQPDQVFPATESTYISGGSNANTNFSSASSMKAKYDSSSASNQALSYFKFDFSSLAGTSADAAKIRIYVNGIDSGTANLHLYGLANDSWNASTMTWNNGAPNHSGYSLTGTEGVDYFDLGATPSYDPVNQVAVYDFDVTDYLNEHAYGDGKKASFMLRTDTTDNVGVTIDGAAGATLEPQLVISRANVWDYSWVDKVIGWAEAANLKLELMWFGSDTTKHTIDSRVPYYVIRNYEKMQTSDGRVLQEKMAGIRLNDYVYDFHMSKDDPNLRAQEYTALKNLFDHVAVYDNAHGNKKTVVGADIANEPGNQIGKHRSYSPYSQALWTSGGYSSENLFMWDSLATWVQNLGAAVKQSAYPVWTRMNLHSEQFYFLYRNEELKAGGGTSYVDFVGYDPYIGSTDEGFRYGLGLWSDAEYYPYNYGRNLPMIMETSANRSNSDYLNLATLAGGSIYNLYNLMANDGNDMYNNGAGNVPVANNSNIDGIKKTNFWLRTIWHDLATKQPDAAGGTQLAFFNEHADGTADVTKKIRGIDVEYSTANQGVGIAVERSDKSIVLASKTASSFTLHDLGAYGPITMTTGYYDANNAWVSTGTKTFSSGGNDIVVNMNAYETVRVAATASIPARSTAYSINDDYNDQTTGSAPSGWSIGTSGGTVSITNKPGLLDKSMRVERTATAAGMSYADKSFTPVSGVVKLETRVRPDATTQWFAAPYVYDSAGNAIIKVAFDGTGNIAYKNAGGAWTSLQTYGTRTWFKLEMTIDTDADTFDLYINGIKKLSQEPLIAPVTDIAKLRFYTENAPGAADFDCVKVYQEFVSEGLISGAAYKIKNAASGKYLDSDANGAVILAAGSSYDDQDWIATQDASGSWTFRNARSGRYYLDTESTDNSVIWNAGSVISDSLWSLEPVAGGGFRLNNQHAGREYMYATSADELKWNTGATDASTVWIFEPQ